MDLISKQLFWPGSQVTTSRACFIYTQGGSIPVGSIMDRSARSKMTSRRCLLLERLILVTLTLIAFQVSVAAAAASPAVATSDVFIKQNVDLLAQEGGSKIGTVTPGTSAHLLTEQNSTAKIQIEGWSIVGAPSAVFTAMGQRILEAKLTSSGQSSKTVVKQAKDAYGSTWEQVRITGQVPKDSLVPDVATVWDGARQVFSAACSACHALHHANEFTANQWPNILKVMTKRAALNDEQTELVTKYLQAHAKGSDSPL
ncbi:MAG: hypothetical protein ABI155_00550 [Paralcaligenes sp.]